MTILVFPAPAAASAIYAVAFGDSCAGMVGKFLGRIRPAFLHGKSIEGSLACYAVTFFSTYLVLNNVAAALICACAATIAELMPAADVDNILIPLAVGFAASIPSVCLWTI
ncbi:hypothetical protein FACS1894172_16480 [Spirochaetia bacterium]|nr:hypothetical protein FACS1894164_06270 [Spirochaetia bacterium]GHU35149.1 hypothetical protein FACS1894172_16480 [Spirochaetia bacterium]